MPVARLAIKRCFKIRMACSSDGGEQHGSLSKFASMFTAGSIVSKSVVISLLIGCNGSVASKKNFGISAIRDGQTGSPTQHGSLK